MRLKRLGDRAYQCPLNVVVRDVDPQEPIVELTLDVIEDELQIRRIALVAQDGGRQLRASDLQIKLEDMRELVAAQWGMNMNATTGDATLTLLVSGEQQPSMQSNLKNYRATRRVDLDRVASIYRAAEHAPTQAVADKLGVAHRTASLYVKQARDAGLLPAYSRKASSR